ncbi:hypothetical protein CL619_03770 [archaeon]|nr:hypothetical protein [archaeon]
MLNKIAEIKEKKLNLSIPTKEVVNLASRLAEQHFVSFVDGPLQLKENVEVTVIDDPKRLLEIAELSASCLYRPRISEAKQLAALQRFLDDPGAAYFSLETSNSVGYFVMYAGTLCETGQEILFEDVLRARNKGRHPGPALYHPALKAVVALTLEKLDLTEDSHMYVPFEMLDWFDGERLQLHKLGSEYFKKDFPEEFYNGTQDFDIWPSFANVKHLLERQVIVEARNVLPITPAALPRY